MTGRAGLIAAMTVVVLSAFYGVLLLITTSLISAGILTTGFGDNAATVFVLSVLAVAFIVVAVVVGSTTISSAFTLVTASRVREIALRRLLGASAEQERRRIARQGAVMGAAGAAAGAALAVLAGFGMLAIGRGADGEGLLAEAGPIDVLYPLAIVPAMAVAATTAIAAWRGSRGVLAAQPVLALGAAATHESGATGDERVRITAPSVILLSAGALLLAVTGVLGALTPLAVLVGLLGGVLLVIGVIMSIGGILPHLFRLLTRLLPRGGSGGAARRSLAQTPVRAARASLGVVLSTAVVAMFATGTAIFEASIIDKYYGTGDEAEVAEILTGILAVVGALVSVIALISAIGLTTTVALTTRLRAREIATGRVLGQSRRDAVRAILVETAVVCTSAAVAGLLLGAALGWVGAQSVLASALDGGIVPLVIPPALVVGLLVATIALGLVASASPGRFVLADSPARAFARA
ncbi:ABC transporter permease [Microcella daejeonensis]|uniref:ABC transporter permease n=1 Tax=Microcella daejeonensis TaxID=2994971 RepID=A0A9E8MKR8_9MICO|nr:ABC transporter permease [Microcella daejeonensis]WAB81399.1 ABC transporter permease [Microcella daejeonensis]